MSGQTLVDQALHELTSLTSRRGLLEAVGKGLIGAGAATFGLPVVAQAAAPAQHPRILKPDQPSCANCGGCSCGPGCNQSCGTTGGNCCANNIPCRYCGSGWCYSGTGICGCPASNPATIYGWYWYCCSNGQLWECNDCCDPSTYACVCTTRCNTQLAC